MMKKQIFSLMLSAAIFTTSPLFAMDNEVPEEKRVLSVHPQDKKFEDVNRDGGTGILNIFPNDMITSVIG